MKILETACLLSFFSLFTPNPMDPTQADQMETRRAQSGGHFGPADDVYGDRWPHYPARQPIPPSFSCNPKIWSACAD